VPRHPLDGAKTADPPKPTNPTASSWTTRRSHGHSPKPIPPIGPAEGKPRPRPDAPQPIPGHNWTTRQRHHAQKPGHNPPRRRSHAKGPGAHAPRPFFCTRHQPHKNARSARSAIPRRITSAVSAPVTAPFLRLLRYSPSPSVKPVSTVLPSSK
jgi:hypothetical protein